MSQTHSIPIEATLPSVVDADAVMDRTLQKIIPRHRVLFVVESGTDVRLVEGLGEITSLSVLVRKIEGGHEISQEPSAQISLKVGPGSRAGFAELVFRTLVSRKREYDACLVQGYGLAALAANCAAKLTRKPTLMLVCSPSEEYYRCRIAAADTGNPYREFEYRAMQSLARMNAGIGGSYLVLSRHLETLVRSHGTRGPIHVIPAYGVDLDVFRPAAVPRPVLKAELGLPATGTLILSSSRVAPEKDTETLLQALSQLLAANRDVWLLTLTGRHEQFRKLATQFGVAERVIVADAVHPTKSLPAYYQASDLCVQVSRAEGLGFSPLEALSCGTPVVATATGGLRETIVEGVTGWTHAVGDSKDLAAKIAEAIDNPEESVRRAASGRDMVCREYERRAVFRALAECFDRLVRIAR